MRTVDREFEQLVMPFLEANPSVSHEWRTVHGWLPAIGAIWYALKARRVKYS